MARPRALVLHRLSAGTGIPLSELAAAVGTCVEDLESRQAWLVHARQRARVSRRQLAEAADLPASVVDRLEVAAGKQDHALVLQLVAVLPGASALVALQASGWSADAAASLIRAHADQRPRNTLRDYLKAARKQAGLTMAAACARLALARHTLVNMERGLVPPCETLETVARGYGLDIGEVMVRAAATTGAHGQTWLAEARRAAGLLQTTVAVRTGMAHSTVSRLESEANRGDFRLVIACAEVVNVNPLDALVQTGWERKLARRLLRALAVAAPTPHLWARLRELRRVTGLAGDEVAERLGICQGTLSGHETGMHTPSFEQLEQYAELYDCDPIDLLVRTNAPAWQQARTDAGLTRTELAGRTGLAPHLLRRLELRGPTKHDFRAVTAVARALGHSPYQALIELGWSAEQATRLAGVTANAEPASALAAYLREAREAKGQPLEELAAVLAWPVARLERYENATARPAPLYVSALADACEFDLIDALTRFY